MEVEKDIFAENSGKGLTAKEIVMKYLSHFPLFIVSFVVCVGIGVLYVKYTVPKFKASTMILVKGNQGNSVPGSSGNDLVSAAVNGKSAVNLNNELMSLKSNSLMQRVVAKNGYNISYYYLGRILKTDMYLDAPFRFIPQNIKDSNSNFAIKITGMTNDGGTIEYGPEDKVKTFNFKWNSLLSARGMSFILAPRGGVTYNAKDNYLVTWSPIYQTASELESKMAVSILDPKMSIIQLDITIENMNRGKSVLNSVVREYNLADMEDRNIVTQNTIRFIDDRLSIISQDLSGVEGNLENYQGSNDIVDMSTQQGQAFSNSNELNKNLKEIGVQQSVASMILDYFNNPNMQDKLVPSTLGLNDPTLSALMAKYNELQLQKQKEAPFSTKNSITMRDLNNQINDVRGSVLEALQNITKNLRLQESSLQQQNSQYRQFLSSLPRKERAMQEIKRKQSVTEGLYLYLLQKREESAITSTSANVANYKQIDPAVGLGQVEPNGTNIKLYSAILGLLLPIGFIYLKDMLNDKVVSRDDITRKLPMPILGDIGHDSANTAVGLSVLGRGVVAEQFRIIRTSLALLKNKEKQVILVTSSTTAEGKSFISLNLAAVLAIPGKKVALLEFDLRKPTILRSLKMNNNVPGITNYIKGKVSDLSEIAVSYEEIPNLHIYPSGPIPSNPGDLLINERVTELFDVLKQEYDYIIVDSAPAGMVSDAFILGELCDLTLYVIRQRVTLKKQMDYINDIFKMKKLKNIGIILNDVKTGGKYGYYGYGNSYGYSNYEEGSKKRILGKPAKDLV